jgi:ATP-dependent exoDNAse (exonuclease V) alpha subunit
MGIELNDDFRRALDLMENGVGNLFITGKAGTGKSTLLSYFRGITKKNIVVLAPTGVAALNIEGQTIHSFFGFRPDITLDKIVKVKRNSDIYRELDMIIIDEVSMVRADLLDCVDEFLRKNCDPGKPFGGKRMIFIGDLYQLPPVVSAHEEPIFKEHYETPYFFSSDSIRNSPMELVELEKVYRQSDEMFISILNAIRTNIIRPEMVEELNRRVDREFEPPDGEFYVSLTPYNKNAHEINARHMDKVKSKEYTFRAEVLGDFEEKNYPVENPLVLKEGAQVMLLNNDPMGRWVNGSMGKIAGIDTDEEIIHVQLHEGGTVEVGKFQWSLFRYEYDPDARSILSSPVGMFTQYPIRPAWAVTIHKSQGKTFDRVIIDMGRGAFSPGQTYVALSRCKSLDGIVLRAPLRDTGIWTDWRVTKFMTNYRYGIAEQENPAEDKLRAIQDAIKAHKKIEIVYLKTDDTKSTRLVTPEYAGEMEYNRRTYTGLRGYCHTRNESRTFRIDRILELRVLD